MGANRTAQPVRYEERDYPSLNAAYRATGHHHEYMRREGELLPTPAPIVAPGAEGAAARIARAASEIRAISSVEQRDHGMAVSLGRRRMGLLKAIHGHRERFGQGVTEIHQDG